MRFRQIDKDMLAVKVPIDLVTEIRAKSAMERRSISEVVSELVCVALRHDPKEFGIEPKPAMMRSSQTQEHAN
jgi:hypothetical protein